MPSALVLLEILVAWKLITARFTHGRVKSKARKCRQTEVILFQSWTISFRTRPRQQRLGTNMESVRDLFLASCAGVTHAMLLGEQVSTASQADGDPGHLNPDAGPQYSGQYTQNGFEDLDCFSDVYTQMGYVSDSRH